MKGIRFQKDLNGLAMDINCKRLPVRQNFWEGDNDNDRLDKTRYQILQTTLSFQGQRNDVHNTLPDR